MYHKYGAGFGPDDPVYEIGLDICDLLVTASEHFPSLAKIALLPGCNSPYSWEKQVMSFADKETRSTRGVRQLASMFDDVGIVLLDEDGVPWQPKWFDEN